MTTEEIAKVVAQWWSDAIERQEPGSSGDLLIDMKHRMDRRDAPGAEALAVFRASVERAVSHFGSSGNMLMSVDYEPDPVLTAALQAAGIEARLPLKTRMWIRRDSVTVRAGYRAPEERICGEVPA